MHVSTHVYNCTRITRSYDRVLLLIVSKKKLSNEIYEQMYVLSENMKNVDILEKYQKKEEDSSIPDIGLRKLDVKKFTTKFSLWKKKSGKKK